MKHPDYLTITYEQFREWGEYFERNPWGESRADQRQRVLVDAVLAPWRKGETDLWPYYPYQQPLPDEDFTIAASEIVAKYLVYDEAGKPRWTIPYEEVCRRVNQEVERREARDEGQQRRGKATPKRPPSPEDRAL